MAITPSFAATVNNGSQKLGSAETSLTVPTTTSVLVTAGASGSKIEEVSVQANATTVAGLVYLFLYDGTTYHLFDTLGVSANTASTTTTPYRTKNTYTNLVLKSGWSLRASQSIAGNANVLEVAAFGGDY